MTLYFLNYSYVKSVYWILGVFQLIGNIFVASYNALGQVQQIQTLRLEINSYLKRLSIINEPVILFQSAEKSIKNKNQQQIRLRQSKQQYHMCIQYNIIQKVMSSSSQQSYLAAIEQLIKQNETVKQTNRRLTGLCQDLLDDVVSIFTQFFPSIAVYDSHSIFKAGQQICTYYRKELLLVKTQLCKSLLQVLNLYGMQIDDDLDHLTFDSLKDFVAVMKSGKGSLIQQINNLSSLLQEIQSSKSNIQKEGNLKDLQIRKLCIDALQRQSQNHSLRSSKELMQLQIANLTKQLTRSNYEYQTLQAEFSSTQLELSSLKIKNEELRRQVLNLQKQRMDKRFTDPGKG